MFFQIVLIFGAPWGRITHGGTQEGALPLRGRVLAAFSILALLFLAASVLSAAGFPGLSLPRWTAYAALFIQGASMLANWAMLSLAERAIWGAVTPIMLALSSYALLA